MLIRPLGLKQFDQGVSKKPIWPCLGWLKGSYGINKGTQNNIQTTPKWSYIEPKANPKKQKE
jgi:hypothetical protein